jgi:Holliday junction resolvase RusA-like endonuclease
MEFRIKRRKPSRREAPVSPEPETQEQAEVSFTFDMPPSVNKQYVAVRHGKRRGKALSPEAKAYREHVKRVIGQAQHKLVGFPTGDLELVYQLDITLWFEKLENPGWFQRDSRGERKAKTRYKVIDVDNRRKFLQDWFCKCIGIPGDEQVFRGVEDKMEGTPERVEVTLRVVDRGQFFPRKEAR